MPAYAEKPRANPLGVKHAHADFPVEDKAYDGMRCFGRLFDVVDVVNFVDRSPESRNSRQSPHQPLRHGQGQHNPQRIIERSRTFEAVDKILATLPKVPMAFNTPPRPGAVRRGLVGKPRKAGNYPVHVELDAEVKIDGEVKSRLIDVFDGTIAVTITGPQRVEQFIKDSWQWLWTALLVRLGGWWNVPLPRRSGRSNVNVQVRVNVRKGPSTAPHGRRSASRLGLRSDRNSAPSVD
jgi:hypothetical protein